MLEITLLLFLGLLVAAGVQGFIFGRMGDNLRHRQAIPAMGIYQFQIEFGWDNTWPYGWAAMGVCLVTAFWAVTMWQDGWSYQAFFDHYRLGGVPCTLFFTLIPALLWSANWIAQYYQVGWRIALVQVAGIAMITLLGPVAWPVITVLWLPGLAIKSLCEWIQDYQWSRKSAFRPAY